MQNVKLSDFAKSKLLDGVQPDVMVTEGQATLPLTRTYLPTMSFDQIEPAPVFYFWDGRLPYGSFCILEGRTETGKSTVCCALAAALTAGRRLPGRTGRERASVLWLQIEDDPRTTLRPRLEAAGADLTRVHLVGRDEHRRVRITLPEDTEALGVLAREKGARMIIIEPITSFVRGSLVLKDEQDARTALEPLTQLAQDQCLLILGQRHLTKGKALAVDQGLGSVGVGNLARAVMRCDHHPSIKGRKVIWRVKGNLGLPPEAISYTIETVDGVGRVEWGRAVDLEGERIEADTDVGTRDVIGDAIRLLKGRLKEAPVPYQSLIGEALSAGISERTLRSAKARLGVRSIRRHLKGEVRWFWVAPKKGWTE